MATARSTSFALARSLIDDIYEDECYDFVYGLDDTYFQDSTSTRTGLLRSLLRLPQATMTLYNPQPQMPQMPQMLQQYYYDWDVPGFLTYGSTGL